MDPLTVKCIHSKINTEKNGNVSYTFQQLCGLKFINFKRLNLIKFIRNICIFLYYVHSNTNNQINEKFLLIPSVLYICVRTYCPNCHNRIPIRTYISHILVRFNIHRNLSVSLSIRVSDSGQSVKISIESGFRSHLTHHTILHNHVI